MILVRPFKDRDHPAAERDRATLSSAATEQQNLPLPNSVGELSLKRQRRREAGISTGQPKLFS